MRNRRNLIFVLISLLVIGFASVSTTLIINGIIGVGESNDFKIIFTDSRLDKVIRKDFISEGKQNIIFKSNILKSVGDSSTLEYAVTNTSRNYNANVSIKCNIIDLEENIVENNEYFTIEYSPSSMFLLAGETKKGSITARMTKLVSDDVEYNIKCTLNGTPTTREELGNEYIEPFSKSGVMMFARNNPSSTESIWVYRSNVTKVEFENELKSHKIDENNEEIENVLEFDVSSAKDGSVMAYLVPNGETLTTNKDYSNKDLVDTTAYTLYIQGDTGVKANSNSHSLFEYFNNLLEINNLKYLDTSNVTSMSFMFNYCSNLSSLDLSSFDTSKVTDMGYMFGRCHKLTSLDLSNFDTSKVTDMYFMFYGCENLLTLDVSGFDTGKVTDMRAMFYNCKKLTELDVSNFDTSNVEYMGGSSMNYGMFSCCYSLKELNVSNFNTSKVKSMAFMFYGCRELTTLDVSHFDTLNVTNMAYLFSGCSSLTVLYVNNFNTSKVTNMGGMFFFCSKLTTLDVNHFDTSNVTSMSQMFFGCTNLATLNLGHIDTSNVTDMQSMFSGCEKLMRIDVSYFDTSKVTNMGGMFSRCTNLEFLNISNFDTSKVTNMSGMFYYCTNLKSLDLSNFNTSNVVDMNVKRASANSYYGLGGMFESCSSLEEIDLSNFNTNNVTTLTRMFSDCTKLKKVNISNFNVSNVTQTVRMFESCSSLEEIDISNWNLETIKDNEVDIEYMFRGIPTNSIIRVKDNIAQEWILRESNNHPSSWNTSNVIVKEV